MTKKTETETETPTPEAPKKIRTALHTIFHTDRSAEEDGAWVTVNAARNIEIKVRRLKSDFVQKESERIITEMFGDGSVRTISDLTAEQMEQATIRHLAETVLVDWKVVDEESGEQVPYSASLGVDALQMRDFREFVTQAAESRDAFREKADNDAEKNS